MLRAPSGKKMRRCSVITMVLWFMVIVSDQRVSLADSRQADAVQRFSVKIIRTIAHDRRNFTQGLLFHDKLLYESSGLTGRSTLQCISAKDGSVLKKRFVPHVFAEGLALWDESLIQLTWKGQKAFIFNRADFTRLGTFIYDTQGWGLTADSAHLIMSDGSDTLYFRNPDTFRVEREIQVTLKGAPVLYINELEYVDGRIFANVWRKNHIIIIDSFTGRVEGIVDAADLLSHMMPLGRESVLNGIAYDKSEGTFYLTGKQWPLIFEVELVPED